MRGMIVIYKQKGETPLQSLDRLRKEKLEYAEATLSYAGRLDPMAEGVMVVLVGEECKDREKYLGLDKVYVTEVLLGVATDTGDVLGKIVNRHEAVVNRGEIQKELEKSVGKFVQKYPAYSSKSFAGDYEKVKNGEVAKSAVADRPTQGLPEFREEKSHIVEIYSAELLEVREISAEKLLEKIHTDIAKVSGDFRQAEILKLWQKELTDKETTFSVAKMRLSVSSGFYVRQFAEDFGKKFNVPALALSILREKVGEWGISDCTA